MHDFKRFPELTERQMQIYYFESPHKQIMDDFRAKVVKVTDGDTIRVTTNFRDFDFPIRLADIQAPELSEIRGKEGREWLAERIMGKEVDINIDRRNRISKWGRLLGEVIHLGMSMNDEIVKAGFAVKWEERDVGKIPDFNKQLEELW